MDYAAIDRAMSRAVILMRRNGCDHRFWISECPSECATDIPSRAKIFNRIADALECIDRNRDSYPYWKLEAVCVSELYNPLNRYLE